MNLDDTELLWAQSLSEFREIGIGSQRQLNEDNPVLPATELWPISIKYTFWQCINYVDIARLSSARGCQTRVRWENKLFSSTVSPYIENIKRRMYAYKATIND